MAAVVRHARSGRAGLWLAVASVGVAAVVAHSGPNGSWTGPAYCRRTGRRARQAEAASDCGSASRATRPPTPTPGRPSIRPTSSTPGSGRWRRTSGPGRDVVVARHPRRRHRLLPQRRLGAARRRESPSSPPARSSTTSWVARSTTPGRPRPAATTVAVGPSGSVILVASPALPGLNRLAAAGDIRLILNGAGPSATTGSGRSGPGSASSACPSSSVPDRGPLGGGIT